jgi:two-component system, OmpR family, sensor histidine kinase KdpD
MRSRPIRILMSLAGLTVLTAVAHKFISVNASTVGFAYLLPILIVASTWGFIEAFILSIVAAFAFNFFFLPPVGNLTIADPQNWVALFTFLSTSLIASILRAHSEDLTVTSRPGETTFGLILPILENGEQHERGTNSGH